jgi:hypothetical protein
MLPERSVEDRASAYAMSATAGRATAAARIALFQMLHSILTSHYSDPWLRVLSSAKPAVRTPQNLKRTILVRSHAAIALYIPTERACLRCTSPCVHCTGEESASFFSWLRSGTTDVGEGNAARNGLWYHDSMTRLLAAFALMNGVPSLCLLKLFPGPCLPARAILTRL